MKGGISDADSKSRGPERCSGSSKAGPSPASRNPTRIDHLLDGESSFETWADWILNVVSRRDLNFFGRETSADARAKDRQVESRILHEVSNEFWTRAPSVVNGDVTELIAELAEGLVPEGGPVTVVPPQNDNAIAFHANTAGKIELVDLRHYEALRDDEDTKDRSALTSGALSKSQKR